jgi:hypothetical protein
MSQQKFLIQYTNFLGQTVKDHKTFKQEGKELNKRLNAIRQKALNGKAEIIIA